MHEPSLQLFTVECKNREGGVTTFVVPAYSPDQAIIQAMNCVQSAQEQEPDLTDPFREVDSEVRVGTLESPGSSNVVFGDWSRLYD